MRDVALIAFLAILVLAAAATAQAPVTFNPGPGTEDNPIAVKPGDTITVTNNLPSLVTVTPRHGGYPPGTGPLCGDPFFVLVGTPCNFTVPNNPALLGMPFDLDPDAGSNPLPGA